MQYILDNPAWNALISGNINLSAGNSRAKYFMEDVSRFAGTETNSQSDFHDLFSALPSDRDVAVFCREMIEIPQSWQVVNHIPILQMVYAGLMPPAITDIEFIALGDEHIPAMLALTKLTAPGPFLSHTIYFGNYYGIFQSGQLIAMAGRRLQPLPYMEISAVCNHPDHLGKGYASRLIQHQISLIIAEKGIPFLHVTTNNANAIGLYQKLGFIIRKEMSIYVIRKESALQYH